MLRAKPGLTFSLATGVARHRETPGALEKNDPRSGEAILPTGNLSFTRTVKWKRSRMGHHRPTSLLTILCARDRGSWRRQQRSERNVRPPGRVVRSCESEQ